MANKDNPGMRLVNLWMTRSDADALIRIANAQGIGRSELLRRLAQGLIEHDNQQRNAA